MKMIGLPVLAVVLAFSGVTLAQQSGDQKESSSMKEPMSDMMKGKESGEGGMHGMGDMNGRMGMMKMMQQCAAMMQSVDADGDAKETQKQ
jgi:hypothetical protein